MTLEKISQLINILNAQGITYCHWKSNFTIARSLAGDDDLDLLVDQKSLPKIMAILLELGIKPAYFSEISEPAGIFHFYGFDPIAERLFHIHLFSKIQTGASFVKNHLLPFETMLFESVSQIGEIKVASKQTELILFVLRTFIKYGSLLDLFYILGKSKSIRAELEWLQNDEKLVQSLNLLEKYCPVIEPALFVKCINALQENNALVKKAILAQMVRRRLRIYRIHNPFSNIVQHVNIIWRAGKRRLVGKRMKKILRTGGVVIAFVGAEATGKSTLVMESRALLEQAFAVRTIHAGKPPSSWFTFPLKIVLPLGRKLLPHLRPSQVKEKISAGDNGKPDPKNSGLTGLIYAIRSVGLAWDRRNLLVKARRSAANAKIIICDRYPSKEIGAIDGPRLEIMAGTDGVIGLIYNLLAKIEGKLYREIPPPDIVLKLKVSMETAKKRNRERVKIGKESDEYLEIRHSQTKDWNMAGTKHIITIDTEQSLAETILKVKQSIWEAL